MVNLHIFSSDKNQKFSYDYVKFLNAHFDMKKHKVILINNPNKMIPNQFEFDNNIYFVKKNVKGSFELIKEIKAANQVYIHGFNWTTLTLILLFPYKRLIEKCNWVIWGGDLYKYKYRERNLKTYLQEIFRRRIIRNVGGLITQLYGDYKLAQKWYGAEGTYYNCFLYPSNLYKPLSVPLKEENEEKYIQLGNSACPTNNHIDILEGLSKFKHDDFIIICPLSYDGNLQYKQKVIDIGIELFGDTKFIPMMDFLPHEEYLKTLSKIDIAIFNHKRQRGLGNITTLLGLGKKVYLREEITTWDFCKAHGLRAYSINNEFDTLFEPMNEEDKKSNHEIMKRDFSEEKLIEDWNKIFTKREQN